MTLVGLAARNVMRNRFRAVLTVLGVAVAILTFILLRTVVMAWTVGADYAMKDRLFTRHKITFVMTLPKRYIVDLRAVPHVKSATYANWFGGKDPKHDREFFATLAIDSSTYFDVMDDFGVAPDELAAWQKDPEGALVGDALAKKMGWKVGDKVILESGIYADKSDWEFHIDGFYEPRAKSADRSTFLFHWDYLNRNIAAARQDQIGWMASRVDDPRRAVDVAVGIDRMFEEREVQTLSQDEHSFQTSFLASVSAVLAAIDVISVVILVIMMLVLGNTIAMGARERTNEYGVLKALGFSGGHIAAFVLGEAMIIAALGGAVGIALAYPIVNKVIGRMLEENMGAFFPYFRVDPGVAAVAFGLALLLGALASALPAARASRLRVVDALRRVA
jgi:putative ABC transport system permease protein